MRLSSLVPCAVCGQGQLWSSHSEHGQSQARETLMWGAEMECGRKSNHLVPKKKKKRFVMGVKVDVMSGFSPLSLSLNVTEYSLLCLYKSVRFLRIYPARVLNMILSRFYSIYLSDRLTYCCRTTVPLCVTLWSFSLLFSCGNILVLILLLLID